MASLCRQSEMSRNLETRLAKLEAAQVPAVVTHMLFAQTDAEADAQVAERIAEGTAKESDEFIVIRWLAAKDDRPFDAGDGERARRKPDGPMIGRNSYPLTSITPVRMTVGSARESRSSHTSRLIQTRHGHTWGQLRRPLL